MKNKNPTLGIIDLKFNNLLSIYKASVQSGFKTSIISDKQKNLLTILLLFLVQVRSNQE